MNEEDDRSDVVQSARNGGGQQDKRSLRKRRERLGQLRARMLLAASVAFERTAKASASSLDTLMIEVSFIFA